MRDVRDIISKKYVGGACVHAVAVAACAVTDNDIVLKMGQTIAIGSSDQHA